ncbi:hypothetical protein GCM10027614_28800 [Micromonospora vulcania]
MWRAKKAFTAGGKSYRAGSYVVDMHQPKRGLVNSLLEPGADITDRVDDLYAGPAAWSQGLTWGATVDTVWDTLPGVRLERAYDGRAEGTLPAGRADLRLDLRDAADLLTVNSLLAKGVAVHRLADGSVVIPGTPTNRRLAAAEVRAHGVSFERAPAGWQGTGLDRVVVGYLGSVEERDTLADLGFEARAVTAATLAGTLTDDVDVLLVAGNVNLANLTAENRAALDRFLARGGGVVGLGTGGAAFSNATALLSVTAAGRAWPAEWPTSSTTGDRSPPRRSRTRSSASPSGSPTWAPTSRSNSRTPPTRCSPAGGPPTAPTGRPRQPTRPASCGASRRPETAWCCSAPTPRSVCTPRAFSRSSAGRCSGRPGGDPDRVADDRPIRGPGADRTRAPRRRRARRSVDAARRRADAVRRSAQNRLSVTAFTGS